MKIQRFFCFAIVLSFVMSFAGVSQVYATFSGSNGKIAYVKNNGESFEIWMLNIHSGEQRIKSVGAQPVWSPDGKKLAFVGEDNHIWVMNAQGHHVYMVTKAKNGKDSAPMWASNGKKLAFVRENTLLQQSAIMTIRLDTSLEKNVSGWGMFRSPSWSPRGDELVYEDYVGSEHKLVITNMQTYEQRDVTTLSENIESRVAWSSTGKKLLYNDSAGQVYTIWPDGSHRAVISDGDSYDASWSPDGEKIAFIEDPRDDHISISEEDGTIMWMPVEKGRYHTIGAPVWSPDGTALLFTMSQEGVGQIKTDTFYLKLGSSVPVKLADGELMEPDWQAK